MPARWAELSFLIGGKIEEILVEEGDGVIQGAPLIRLSARELENAIESAKANQQIAQAELQRVKAGPRVEEIVAAENAVQEARAGLEKARAYLRQSQANYEQVTASITKEELTIAKSSLQKAEAALRQAQAEYDEIKWYDAIGSSPQALALQRATLDYEAAKAEYDEVLNGASSQEIAAAQSEVDAARASVWQAEAMLSQSQANLNLLKAGSRMEEIQVAEAKVSQANAELNRAVTNLEQATLRAPFAATIGDIYVRMGEQVIPERPALVLGNLNHLRVETTDLRETDIARVKLGQVVEITFDALPDVILKGHVSHISPKSSDERGSVSYPTIIEFDEFDDRLRWGMTAYINIRVG